MTKTTMVLLVAVSLLLLQQIDGANVDCQDQQGLVFTACDGGGPQTSVVSAPGTGGNPFTSLACCTPHTHTGPATGYFEFSGGPGDLVILCAKIQGDKTIRIRNFHCTPNGGCQYATLSNAAQYPMTIPINGPRFRIIGGIEITFMVTNTNTADESCTCPTQCATDWTKNGDYCYRVIEESLGFHQAEDKCDTLHSGAHLLSLHSDTERDWVKNNVQTSDTIHWIGLFDIKLGESDPRRWRWTDCTPFIYQNWNDGEPNDSDSIEDCIEQITDSERRWNDKDCTETRWGICKYYLGPQ